MFFWILYIYQIRNEYILVANIKNICIVVRLIILLFNHRNKIWKFMNFYRNTQKYKKKINKNKKIFMYKSFFQIYFLINIHIFIQF
jgi:hypothetical protein